MIRFIRIEAYDAFSYKFLDFDFRAGLSAIEGVNGSAKSSLFMVLAQGLFNRNPKGCKVDEVNNYITQKPYEIHVIFEKEADRYVVINSRKQGKIQVSRNGQDISFKRMPDNLTLISEILGTDYTTFVDLVYQSKETTLNILETSTDRGRKEFIARVLKLDEIDAQQARMKEKEKELVGKNGRIALLQSQIQTMESSLGVEQEIGEEWDTVSDEQQWKKLGEEILQLSGEILLLETEIQDLREEIETWEAEQQLRSRLDELTADFDSSLVVDLQQLQSQVTEESEYFSMMVARGQSLKELIQQLERFTEVKQRRALTQEELKNLPRPEMTHEDCVLQYDKIVKAKSACSSRIDQLTKELKNFQSANEKGVCPTCGAAADVTKQVAELAQSLKDEAAYAEKCRLSLSKYEAWIKQWKEVEVKENELQRLEAEEKGAPKGELEPLKKELVLTEKQISLATDKRDAAKKAYNQGVLHEKQRTEILEIKSRLTHQGECNANEIVANKTVVLATKNQQLRDTSDARRLLDCSIRSKNEHNAKVRASRELQKQIRESNHKLQLQIDQSKKELEACECKLDLLKTWQGILGSKGYRVARIKIFISSLNTLMAKYALMISGGRIKCNFFITETGEIDFTITDEAKEMAYELWSGGEKARVKLVCLFSVLELLETMGSLSFNVLALDEIFDQLDVEGKEGLFNLLSHLKGRGKAIYTIAHSDLALDLVYDHKVKAQKLQDGTTEVMYAK